MTRRRPVVAFADSALTVSLATVDDAHALAAAVASARLVGVDDVVIGFRSLTVVLDPVVADPDAVAHALAITAPAADDRPHPARVEIPVALDGPDRAEVARSLSLPPERVAEMLTGSDLSVAFVGFVPGFAYLVGLPGALAAIPRRPTPRPVVPAGSVAIGGGFAAVYPQASPGGWHLLGSTPVVLFDPAAPPYGRLRPGDVVRFVASDSVAPPAPGTGAPRPALRPGPGPHVVVDEPGLLSFVQDAGRRGVAHLGVPRAGAADPYALRTANRLVGNAESAAAIETTGRGPVLRFAAATHVAVVGSAPVTVDGHDVPTATVVPVEAGQTMTVGVERRGLRGYLAVAGAFDIPPLLGSRSSDVLSRLGPGPLVAGDALPLGLPGRPRGPGRPRTRTGGAGPTVLRVVAGPDAFPAPTVERLCTAAWEVAPSSDRIGVRLASDTVLVAPDAIASRGVVTGAVQLPPDGRPIILLCDHATVGGYPVIATVVSADLGLLGQLRPGDTVHLVPVDRADAARARAAREAEVAGATAGWYPSRAD